MAEGEGKWDLLAVPAMFIEWNWSIYKFHLTCICNLCIQEQILGEKNIGDLGEIQVCHSMKQEQYGRCGKRNNGAINDEDEWQRRTVRPDRAKRRHEGALLWFRSRKKFTYYSRFLTQSDTMKLEVTNVNHCGENITSAWVYGYNQADSVNASS
ncbi:hypothetical protein K438DRAFT_1784333 [Mycena galopus ATCC 62051]|nr:hypothetical protein K438DRAFT_1784333 [Mycena galopus ATCC 62051]